MQSVNEEMLLSSLAVFLQWGYRIQMYLLLDVNELYNNVLIIHSVSLITPG